MPFLNPFLLWGLAFASVPLLLLLLRRRRLRLPWAAYEWMRRAVIVKRRRIRVDEILKLISKILLLIAIALFLARPFIRQRGAGGRTLVIVDVSPSMNTLYQGKTRLQRTMETLSAYIEEAEQPVAIYTLAGNFEPVVASFSTDKPALKAAVTRIEQGHSHVGARSFFTQLMRLPILREAESILFLGDFQDEWYGNLDEIMEGLNSLGRAYPMRWHRIDPRTAVPNCAVLAILPPSDGLFPGRPGEIVARIGNASASASDDRNVALLIDGEIRAQTMIRLQPGEIRDVMFPVTFHRPGWHSLEVRLNHDELHLDDARMAALLVPDSLRIAMAAPPHRGEDRFPYEIHLRAALHALFDERHLVVTKLSPLELVSADLHSTDILFLCNVSLEPGMPYLTALRSFLERGGNVAAFLPARRDNEAAGLGIEAALVEEGGPVLSERLAGSWLAFMDRPGLNPENIRFRQSLVFRDVPPEETRLTVEAGVIAAVRRTGAGRLAVFGFQPYAGYGNLPYNPNFVQMVLRTVAELRGAQTLHEISVRTSSLPEPGLDREAAYTLTREALAPLSLAVEGVGHETKLLLPEIGVGFFSVLKNGEEWSRFARNIDAGDGNLDAAPTARLKPAEEHGLYLTEGMVSPAALSRVDLWPWMLALLLAAGIFEAYAHFLRKK
jgi:hypothetical protein